MLLIPCRRKSVLSLTYVLICQGYMSIYLTNNYMYLFGEMGSAPEGAPQWILAAVWDSASSAKKTQKRHNIEIWDTQNAQGHYQ